MTATAPPLTMQDVQNEREKLEALLWEQTEWRGTAETMVKILKAVDAYADLRAAVLTPTPKTRPETVEHRTLPIGVSIIDPVTGEVLTWGAPLGPGQLQCRACFHVKPQTEYQRDKASRGGWLPRCKACVAAKRYVRPGTSTPAVAS